MNKDFALLKTIFLMFLNDHSQHLKTFKNKKNKKILKVFLYELNDNENFVDKKTLIMK